MITPRDAPPAQSLPWDLLQHELTAAFAPWGAASGITFVRGGAAADANLTLRWGERAQANEFLFDGPGGALAVATASTITFDAAERWELRGAPHPHRGVFDWDEMYFQLLPVRRPIWRAPPDLARHSA